MQCKAIIILLLVGPQKSLKYFQVKMSFPYPNEKKFKTIRDPTLKLLFLLPNQIFLFLNLYKSKISKRFCGPTE